MAKRTLLRDMTGDAIVAHYNQLKTTRISRAQEQADRTYLAGLSREIQDFAIDKVVKARLLALDRKAWQISAARRMMKQQGVRAAAGFLRAYGWDLEEAREFLLGL